MMDGSTVSDGKLDGFLAYLEAMDRSDATVRKYGRDLAAFLRWLDDRPLDRAAMAEYKRYLSASGRPAASVNSVVAAMNGFAAYLGLPGGRTKYLRVQRRVFRDASRDMAKADYTALVDEAYGSGRERLGLMLEAMGSTGMRVSELEYVTVETVSAGVAEVSLKNKVRTVMFPSRLREKLLAYAAARGIRSGRIFVTGTGRPVRRQQLWREMKALCGGAGVEPSKVYPHNFRHLFASEFYGSCHDVVKLADVLGHSSVDTTRIYLISSGKEHARQLELLGMVR